MGDRLAEFLYTTFVSSSGQVAGGDVPGWGNLSSDQRDAWEQVAARARGHLLGQVFTSLDTYLSQHPDDPAQAVAALRKAWGR